MKPYPFFCLLLFIGFSSVLHGQVLFSPAELGAANTAGSVSYMSDEEKKVVQYMNLARMDGDKFYQSFIPEFLEYYNRAFSDKIQPNNKYLLSLKADLKKVKGLVVLQPFKNLYLSATFHARDMGKLGMTGHNSSDGTSCDKRIRRFYPNASCWSENCSYGMGSAINIVCQLLIDDGISSLGHRTNILKSVQRLVGVSIAPHKGYNYNCVMDFSCD
ncbi:MAG: CAP domain-containing protein [Mariniphaga sp.]